MARPSVAPSRLNCLAIFFSRLLESQAGGVSFRDLACFPSGRAFERLNRPGLVEAHHGVELVRQLGAEVVAQNPRAALFILSSSAAEEVITAPLHQAAPRLQKSLMSSRG